MALHFASLLLGLTAPVRVEPGGSKLGDLAATVALLVSVGVGLAGLGDEDLTHQAFGSAVVERLVDGADGREILGGD